MDILKEPHIVQSSVWGSFKTAAGTKAVRVGDLQFTKHKIPLIPFYIGYAPKVNFLAQNFDWKELAEAARKENCAIIRFDVPNVMNDVFEKQDNAVLQYIKANLVKSPRSTFSKWNVLLDISAGLDEIEKKFHQKARYNIRLAEKKGVVVKKENNKKGIDIFNKLMRETARRQKFSEHPPKYYEDAFNILHAKNMAIILVAYKDETPLTAWMLFNDADTLYYPYGASSRDHKNLMASNLVAYEAIKVGKELGCKLFDMWGATNDQNSSWWGFTEFKLKYGGQLVEYMESFDYVCNPIVYNGFNLAYNSFWKIKKLI